MIQKLIFTGMFLSGLVTLIALLTDDQGDNASWGVPSLSTFIGFIVLQILYVIWS
jgi:hypothetical protein